MCNKLYLKNFAIDSIALIPPSEKSQKPKNYQIQYFIFLQNSRLDILLKV